MTEIALLAACFWGVAWSLTDLRLRTEDKTLLYFLHLIEANRRAMK